MAEFLCRRGCPDAVVLRKGASSVTVRVRSNGTVRKVTIPDALVASIPADLAGQLVRLDTPAAPAAPASEPPSSGPDEQPTMPATPVALALDRE